MRVLAEVLGPGDEQPSAWGRAFGQRFVSLFIVLTSLPVWFSARHNAVGFSPTVSAAISAIFIGVLAWNAIDSVRGVKSWGIYTFLPGVCVINLLVAADVGRQQQPDFFPWPVVLTTVVCGSAGLIYRTRWAAITAVLALVATYLTMRHGLGKPAVYVGECGPAIVAGALLRAAHRRLDHTYVQLRAADQRLRAAYDDLAQERRAEHERLWWDLLIHDKVLGSLRLAETSVVTEPALRESARVLAREALALMGPQEAPTSSGGTDDGSAALADRLAEQARRLGLHARITGVDTQAPPEVEDSIVAAAAEALTNTAKHSGSATVDLHLRRSETGLEVTVRDHGRGFDVEAIQADRRGLLISMHRRLEAIGGSTTVTSEPGTGTTVTFSWHAPAKEPTAQPVATEGIVRMTGALVPIWLAVWAVHASPYAALVDRPAWAAAGLVVYLGAWAYQAVRGFLWHPELCGALILASATVISLSMPQSPRPDGRDAVWGALTLFVASVGFTGSRWITMAMGVAATTIPIVLAALRLPEAVPYAASASMWSLAWGLLSLGVLAYFRRSRRLLARSEAERQRAVDQRLASRARLAEIEQRLTVLRSLCLPTLDLVAGPASLSATDAQRCREVESATRDVLVAAAVLTEDIAEAIARARALGASVVVTAREPRAPDSVAGAGAALEQFRGLLLELLADVTGRSVLTARWQPEDDNAAASLALTHPLDGGSARWIELAPLARVGPVATA